MEDSALVHPALRRRQHRLEGGAQSLFLERFALEECHGLRILSESVVRLPEAPFCILLILLQQGEVRARELGEHDRDYAVGVHRDHREGRQPRADEEQRGRHRLKDRA